MKEEKEKILKEWIDEVEKIKIDREPNVLNDKSNKPYWDLEKKYIKKLKELEEKYKDSTQK